MKTCLKCGIEKSLSEFNLRSDNKKYKNSCKLCIKQYSKNQHLKNLNKRKDQKLKKAYGISLVEKEEIFILQNGACDICKIKFNDLSKAHVDHCHNTKKVRGLLCTKCNPGIGYFKDSTDILKSAILYLDKHSNKE